MGDIADMMLSGDMCQGCGVLISGNGYAQYCKACESEVSVEDRPTFAGLMPVKVKCDICGKRVKSAGLDMHKRHVHRKKFEKP